MTTVSEVATTDFVIRQNLTAPLSGSSGVTILRSACCNGASAASPDIAQERTDQSQQRRLKRTREHNPDPVCRQCPRNSTTEQVTRRGCALRAEGERLTSGSRAGKNTGQRTGSTVLRLHAFSHRASAPLDQGPHPLQRKPLPSVQPNAQSTLIPAAAHPRSVIFPCVQACPQPASPDPTFSCRKRVFQDLQEQRPEQA